MDPSVPHRNRGLYGDPFSAVAHDSTASLRDSANFDIKAGGPSVTLMHSATQGDSMGPFTRYPWDFNASTNEDGAHW